MYYSLDQYDRGAISAEQLVEAIRYREQQRPQIGALAVRRGKMTMHQVFEVLKKQAEDNRMFGEIAREMKFLTKRQIADLLLLQAELTPTVREALEATNPLPLVSR